MEALLLRLRDRLGSEAGFTLLEMLAVIAILGVVLAGLTQLFTSGANSEIDQSGRVQAQQQTRVALDKMRQEIHCATSVIPTSGSSWPTSSVTITLGSYCPTYTSSAPTITWCTVANSTTPVTYTLRRYPGSACSGTGTSWAQNIVATGSVTNGQIFRSYTTPTQPAMPPPLFTAGGTGSLAAGTYAYIVDPVTSAGEQPGTEGTYTLSTGGQAVTVDWTSAAPPYSGVLGYRVYGRTAGGEQLMCSTLSSDPYTSTQCTSATTETDTGSNSLTARSAVSATLAALNVDMPVRIRGTTGLAEVTDAITLRNTPR